MADKNPIFYNRELSWLEFDKRCLSEAKDRTIPLFERIKFLSITASNLDEFFMVRIASLTDMVHAGYTKRDIAGMTAGEQLDALHASTKEFMKNQYQTLNRALIPQLAQNGLKLVRHHEDLTPKQAKYVDKYFEQARLTRSKTRDEALDTMQQALKNAELSETEKTAVTQTLTNTINSITVESDIENMVKAKGFADCVAFIEGEKINLAVKTGSRSSWTVQYHVPV